MTATNGGSQTWVAGKNVVLVSVTNGGATMKYAVVVTYTEGLSMTVKAIKSFFDKQDGVTRNLGDTFAVSSERYKELNSTKFGVLVEAVAEDKG